jgi:hypothetical protein
MDALGSQAGPPTRRSPEHLPEHLMRHNQGQTQGGWCYFFQSAPSAKPMRDATAKVAIGRSFIEFLTKG